MIAVVVVVVVVSKMILRRRGENYNSRRTHKYWKKNRREAEQASWRLVGSRRRVLSSLAFGSIRD